MAGETSTTVNVEEQVDGGNSVESIHDLVKEQMTKLTKSLLSWNSSGSGWPVQMIIHRQ